MLMKRERRLHQGPYYSANRYQSAVSDDDCGLWRVLASLLWRLFFTFIPLHVNLVENVLGIPVLIHLLSLLEGVVIGGNFKN